MERLDYDTDKRKPADYERSIRFREGWNQGAKPDDRYKNTGTLDDLTWENLGYRMGTLLKSAPGPFIDAMYAMCVLLQDEQKKHSEGI